MNLAADAPLWLALIFAALLIAAAVEDAARLRISNVTSALILVGAIAAALVVGPEVSLWQNLAVFAGLLIAGTPLFATGKFGGGDVKLFACAGLWFDFSGALYLLAGVLLSGGVLAIVILVMRTFGWSEAARRRVVILNAGAGIPYGVAIAAGSLIVMALQRS